MYSRFAAQSERLRDDYQQQDIPSDNERSQWQSRGKQSDLFVKQQQQQEETGKFESGSQMIAEAYGEPWSKTESDMKHQAWKHHHEGSQQQQPQQQPGQPGQKEQRAKSVGA